MSKPLIYYILLPLRILWRIWYYVLIAIFTLLLSPFLLITSISEKWYPAFHFLGRVWSLGIVLGMGFIPRPRRMGNGRYPKGFVICANHVSEIDIMLTFITFKQPFVFIGKKELSKLPLFGYFYKRTNILVDRQSASSRQKVYKMAKERMSNGTGICIYPEGGIPKRKVTLAPFHMGAFKLSAETDVPIIPVTFLDNKKKLPSEWGYGCPGLLRYTVHEAVFPDSDDFLNPNDLKDYCYKIIYSELSRHENHKGRSRKTS